MSKWIDPLTIEHECWGKWDPTWQQIFIAILRNDNAMMTDDERCEKKWNSGDRYVFSFIQNHKKAISCKYDYYINSTYPSQLPLDSSQD